MNRWRMTWAATAVAGVVAVSSNSYGQDPAERPRASPAAPQTTAGTPQDHLKQADAAVKSISSAAISSKAAARIAELKQHLNALQAAAATHAGPSAAASTNAHAGHGASSGVQWSAQAAAADKIIGELLSDVPAGAIGPSTGTEAKPGGGPGTATARGAASLDDDTRAKLTTARAALMAFAAAMGGAASGPDAPSPGGAPAPPPTGSATSGAAAPGTAAAPTNSPAQSSTAPPSTGSTSASGAGKPAAAGGPSTTQSPSTTQATGGAVPATGGSFDRAKQALTAARDSLSQLTKLPAVQALTGEPRVQVSQLISAFNALITTTTDWRGAYAKVDALVTALMGAPAPASPGGAAAPPAAAPPADAGTAGASGVPADGLDPALKAKLAEFRSHLKEFESAANATPGK